MRNTHVRLPRIAPDAIPMPDALRETPDVSSIVEAVRRGGDRAVAEVAAELGISPNAVRIAKSRVLNRFRQEITGLLD